MKYELSSFHKECNTGNIHLECPHCNRFTIGFGKQLIYIRPKEDGDNYITFYYFFYCHYCQNSSILMTKKNERNGIRLHHAELKEIIPIVPEKIMVTSPNQDLDKDIKEDYLEAAKIYQRSPRGACALLRLCLQKLLKQLGFPGKDIYNEIGKLVEKGLDPDIQKALDLVRVIGNASVHPGEIINKDDILTAKKLFQIINYIAENQITNKKKLRALYNEKIPESQKKAINKRDLK